MAALHSSVTFKDGTTTLGTGRLNASARATFKTSILAVGSHSITAVYAGDSSTIGSTSSAVAEVIKATSSLTLTSSANPSTVGQTVTFTVAVTPSTATGSVQFLDGAAVIGTSPVSEDVRKIVES